jgi:hypothetical protein
MTQIVPCPTGFEPMVIKTADGREQVRCYDPETKELR